MEAARLHEYTDEMDSVLWINEITTVAERLEHGKIEGRAVITP